MSDDSVTSIRRRRAGGAICLLAAIGMVIGGDSTPGGRLGKGLAFVVYWLVCFLFTAAAMAAAILDARALRRRTREEQQALFERTFQEIQRQKSRPSGDNAPPP